MTPVQFAKPILIHDIKIGRDTTQFATPNSSSNQIGYPPHCWQHQIVHNTTQIVTQIARDTKTVRRHQIVHDTMQLATPIVPEIHTVRDTVIVDTNFFRDTKTVHGTQNA